MDNLDYKDLIYCPFCRDKLNFYEANEMSSLTFRTVECYNYNCANFYAFYKGNILSYFRFTVKDIDYYCEIDKNYTILAEGNKIIIKNNEVLLPKSFAIEDIMKLFNRLLDLSIYS